MPVTETRKAFLAIEDELALLRGATGVLYLACSKLEEIEPEQSALLRSLHFAAKGIEAAVDRIEEKLAHEQPGPPGQQRETGACVENGEEAARCP